MMDRTSLLAVLLLTVLVAGCTVLPGDDGDDGQTGVEPTQNSGMTISFSSLASSYDEGEDVALRLTAENTGEATAHDLVARMYGPLFFTEAACGALRRGAGVRLGGVDTAAGQSGQETAVEWTCSNTLDLPRGETRDFTAGAALAYEYRTDARAAFRVVPRAAFSGSSSPASTDRTAGPLDVSIDLSTPVTIDPQEEQTTTETTFNVTELVVRPGAGTITFRFNHDIDTGDFNLDDDLQRFSIIQPDGLSLSTDRSAVTVEENEITFPVQGDISNTQLSVGTYRGEPNVENTANEQALRQVICQNIGVGDGETTATCGQQAWRPHGFYWHSMKIVSEDDGVAAYVRFSQDYTFGEVEGPTLVEIEDDRLNATGTITGVDSGENIARMPLEVADNVSVSDLEGQEFDMNFGPRLTDDAGLRLVSRESDRVITDGSCSATFGEDWKTDEDGVRNRHCWSDTEQQEQIESGIAVPVTVRNVGRGMVGDIAQEPRPVLMNASMPNAPSGAGVIGCNGATEFPVSFTLFQGSRDLTCRVNMPESAYDTRLQLAITLTYPYVQTSRTSFTVEGLS